MCPIQDNPNAIRPELIAPCGLNCRLCRAYKRERNPCPGCRLDGPFKSNMCVQCEMKNCEKLVNGSFEFCYECDEFPCKRITHLDKRYRTRYSTSTIANLLSIKEICLANFVISENIKWTCPQCGMMLSMHKPHCRSCGYLWQK